MDMVLSFAFRIFGKKKTYSVLLFNLSRVGPAKNLLLLLAAPGSLNLMDESFLSW
jgi:hypothetical protein